MLNDIADAIARKLGLVFGDCVKVYKNDVKQGLKKPCFFIAIGKPELKTLPGRRFLSINPFDIRYFPENDGDNGELFDVAGRMAGALSFIELLNGDTIRGNGISFEIGDGEEGTLCFHIKYNMFFLKTENVEMMGELILR